MSNICNKRKKLSPIGQGIMKRLYVKCQGKKGHTISHSFWDEKKKFGIGW